MRRIAPLAVLALAVVAVPVVIAQAPGAPGAPGAKDKTRVTAGTYAADAGHTMVVWEVDHLGFSKYTGIFGSVTGTLVLDPKNPAASKVDVTIPVSKVTTANAGLTDHLLRAGKDGGKPDFFGAAPADAKFVSTSVVVDEDGDEAKVTGKLTLNGVTKPVTLDVKLNAALNPHPMSKKPTVGFSATGTIKRSEFGVATLVGPIGDDVLVTIETEFVAQ